MAVLWLRFLTEISEDTDEVPAELLENAEISKALSIVEKAAMTESQLYAYERFWDAVNREHVLGEGKYKEGLAEGMTKRNVEIARSMKVKGYAIGEIIDITGLTSEEIAAL